jgi:hypothetical protein
MHHRPVDGEDSLIAVIGQGSLWPNGIDPKAGKEHKGKKRGQHSNSPNNEQFSDGLQLRTNSVRNSKVATVP